MFPPSTSQILSPWADRISHVRSVISKTRSQRLSRLHRILMWSAIGSVVLLLLLAEGRSSRLQSYTFSALVEHVSYRVEPGVSHTIVFPRDGPFDHRLGYSLLPDFVRRAQEENYSVVEQARDSSSYLSLSRMGIYPIYHEKTQAGLEILDRHDRPFVDLSYPQRIYNEYQDIPEKVVDTLLFIENRAILDKSRPYHNPAIEWTRLSHAALDYGLHAFHKGSRSFGASTLATQLEKLRHSPEGRTHSPFEKLNQMMSASLRVYQDGPRTLAAQQRIVRDYLNSLPLAASPGYGEVVGLGDGLWAWFGADFDEINGLLKTPAAQLNAEERRQRALAFRQVLSLLLATRSPSHYLMQRPEELEEQVDRYLRVLCSEGIISPELRDLALQQHLNFRQPPVPARSDFVENKANNLIRAQLLSLLGVESNHTLDRLDLSVYTTIDQTVQRQTTALLKGLGNPENPVIGKLRQHHLLAQSDPRSVIYSFTLFERNGGMNLLRVQTDTFDQPLNINQGTKLELGSTAKLRTLLNYLQIAEQLHAQYATDGVPRKLGPGADPITTWAAGYFSNAQDKGLQPMLQAALDRRYSASPGEAFFTAGGLHSFANFDKEDNGRIVSIREGFERSVNLVFIRLMRDIERYYLYRQALAAGGTEISEEQRKQYLTRFAEEEGRVFLSRFYRKYEELSVDDSLKRIGEANAFFPKRLAVIYRSVRPEASLADFSAFLRKYVRLRPMDDAEMAKEYERYAPGTFNLQDRGYLAHMHPLELWLLWYKAQHPQATFSEVVRDSAAERQESYAWLFSPRRYKGQMVRIKILQEEDAFQQITKDWRRLGYPFKELVPSYATAIGVSGDTPAALAELMGVISSGGMRYPVEHIRELRFADGTPMATTLARQPAAGERVLSKEIADAVRQELISVVERGTARRAAGGIALANGTVLPLGGKTGTGDNRLKAFAGKGYLIESRIVSRTAVFAFLLGNRYFGTVMAFVPGTSAGNYEFTSALAVQVFKELEPTLGPLLEQSGELQADKTTEVGAAGLGR